MKKRNVLIAILMCLTVFTLIGIGQNFTARGSATQPVDLGSAGKFVILAKSGISNVPTSTITGDIGVSAISSTAITGFPLTMDSTNKFATTAQVNGKVYAADYAAPTPGMLTTAISDMEAAYTNAANAFPPTHSELGAGILVAGTTLTSGIYKWTTGLSITGDITLSGSASDVWIFQISGILTTASSSKILLSGGAHASNIFWQVAGYTQLGTDSSFNGVILDQTAIHLLTGAFLNGRAFAQTAVTLDHNIVQMCPTFVVPEPPIFMALIAAITAFGVFIAFKKRKFHS
jgi:hypothetical protein